MSTPCAVRYADGGQGQALAYAGLLLELTAPRAYAPGQPLSLHVELGEAGWVALSAKAVGSRARSDGGFDVKVRLTNLRRQARLSLEQCLSAS